MDSKGDSASHGLTALQDLAWAFVLTAALSSMVALLWSLPALFWIIVAGLFSTLGGCVLRVWSPHGIIGPANRATLLRASLVIVLFASAPFMNGVGAGVWLYGTLALLALILDGVDGAIARATNSQSEFGARFDMELDAAFILGLCLAVIALGKAGLWVLTLGSIRYGFVLAGLRWRWLNNPLPDSFRRKTICVWQIVTLMVAILPPVLPLFASLTLATALLLLIWSFYIDIVWLYQRRTAHEPA
ncbi:CDP-alcohol phosphatidyltransferase family protein [Marinobacter arenosus]|uniref:CDP-alcohol phosphatidyltransferase family protein n=1 Tax=Marinobacter arenosus TaxID=2856822 RepID=UPI001C4AC290|nr:CDP-alcohol phosphatidyltransferase family protein [Marinobacter arenosus]MBW0146474.1 CDP-alcohol phosphatidyltransferase family protein [Marinobacter arenosus]